jgi:hypothetical protein
VTHTAIHSYIRFSGLWLCCVLYCVACAVSEIDLPGLPVDEDEAYRMLGEGTLDAAVWYKIEPFYTMPVRVPQGDLRILQDLFSELPQNLPSAPIALAPYWPWNDSARQRFFSDFPELIPFKPILSFENDPAVSIPAQAGFYYSRRRNADTARQYALFSIGDPSQISAGGRIDFTDAYGRWFRRTVSVAPKSTMRITCGNFSPDRRNSFFSGFFPIDSTTDATLSNNWLYGTSRTWNGVLLGFSPDTTTGTEAFFHSGRTEEIGHLSGNVDLSRRISCFGGFSYLHTMDPSNRRSDSRYLHAGLDIDPAPSWKCEIQSCFNLEDPLAAPWYFTVVHKAGSSSFKGTLIGVPHQYDAPRSETVRLLRNKGAHNDSTSGYLLNADLVFRHRLNRFCIYSPRLNCIIDGDRLSCLSAVMELSGKALCDYRFWYSWSPQFVKAVPVQRQQVTVECSLPLSKKIEVGCSDNAVAFSSGYWSNRFRMAPCFKLSALELSALFQLYGTRTRKWEKIAGIEQRLLFYKKTFSAITIEQQLPFSSWETIRANGRMSFFF